MLFQLFVVILISLCSFFDFVHVCVVVLHLLEIILHPTLLTFPFFRVAFHLFLVVFISSKSFCVFLWLFLSL